MRQHRFRIGAGNAARTERLAYAAGKSLVLSHEVASYTAAQINRPIGA